MAARNDLPATVRPVPRRPLVRILAMKHAADWDLGATYIAISRLPWLTALAAWGIGSTWTRGMHCVEDPSVRDVDEPDLGRGILQQVLVVARGAGQEPCGRV